MTRIDGVTIEERISAVDILRGFALVGILLINIGIFSNAPGGPPAVFAEVSTLDRTLQNLILLFIESKFFSIFSFLFGLGFSIQLIRAQQRNEAFGWRFTRRLLALLGFGIAHVLFVWDGDILIIYALTGFLLLAFRKTTDKGLLRWVVGLLAVPLTILLLIIIFISLGRSAPQSAESIALMDSQYESQYMGEHASAIALFQTGSYMEIAKYRVNNYLTGSGLLLSRIPTVLAMFLLGYYVGRRGILQNLDQHLPLIRNVSKVAWSVGLPLNLLSVILINILPTMSSLMFILLNQYFFGPVLALAYISTILLLLRRPAWENALSGFSHAGRMALTNYLGQSVVCSFIFWSWGFALTGKVNTLTGLLIGLGIFVTQVWLSKWWLSRFLYGPLEWLWRSITYRRAQPFIKNAV